MEWDGEDRRQPKEWSIRRDISVGDLVTIVGALTAVFVSYFSLDTRIKLLENNQVTMAQSDVRIEHDASVLKEEIKADLKEIKAKVDQINDRTLKGMGR